MINSIRVLIFDLGGTLIFDKDPWPPIFSRADGALWRVLNRARGTLGASDLYPGYKTFLNFHYQFARHKTGLDEVTTTSLLGDLLRNKGQPLSQEALREAMRALYKVTQGNWYPEMDALPTLKALRDKGFRLGLISNAADDENTQKLLDKGKFRPYFEFVLSSAAFGLRKPHPRIFQAALEHFKVPRNQVVMVGDTFEADIVGSQQVGMKSIWITRRVRQVKQYPFFKPDAVVNTLAEIPSLLIHG